MTIKQITTALEGLAPLDYAEDFDNVGLLVGDKTAEVTGVLITHDTLEKTVDEALEKDCNLIVSFHPIIFKGLTSLTGKNYVERTVLKAIKNGVAIYATHTALDNSFYGVNAGMCAALNLQKKTVLIPQSNTIKKLITHVPKNSIKEVREAIFKVGGGTIGNYDNCSFNLDGIGSFRGNEHSNPVTGKRGELHYEEETQLHLTYAKHLEKVVLNALFDTHPYEEVAYEISTLENYNQHIGIGMFGQLESPVSERDFLATLKATFQLDVIRHSALRGKSIKTVAVLGGSGAFGIGAAKAAGADIYITGDLKYHDFYQAENQLVLADIGHYESERFTKELLHSYLIKKFPNFAIVLSDKSTNPIQYT